jgi:hypothetical protein
MSITYEWSISQLESYPTFEDYIDVVFNVHWRVHARDDVYETSAYGTQNISYDGNSSFVQYSDLTETMIVNWVKGSMGAKRVASLESSLANTINDQKNPPVVVLPLPWTTPTNLADPIDPVV